MASNRDPTAWEVVEVTKPDKEMVFCSLHHHTTFSYKDGFGRPEAHARRACELGVPFVALTEHGNVTSHVQHERACDKYEVKAGYGVELYTGHLDERKTQRKNHLTVIAQDVAGYRNLLEMVSRSWAEGFHYEPTVDGNLFRDHSDGLIALSGCLGSLLSTSLVGGKNIEESEASYAKGKRVAETFKDILGDRYYLEVQAFPELPKTVAVNQHIARLSADLGIPLVATLDVHYTKPEESEIQQILHSVRSGFRKTPDQLDEEWGYDVKLCPPISDREIYRSLRATGLTKSQAEQAIRTTAEIASRCDIRLPKVENLRYPLPQGYGDPIELFRRWINDGWKYRGFGALDADERARYIAQAKYEMNLIEEKGFVDYFLVVSDAVKFAKDSGIPVGPARGSAAASLVCYLLRVTEVDPMRFPTLLFERFIDVNRHDLPDIDLDFDDERRHEVREYLVSKYGNERVGNIGTFTRYKGKNSLDDVARVYRVPDSEVARLKNLLIERNWADLRSDATIEDTIDMFPQAAEVVEQYPELLKARLLEGNFREMSVHACGLVIANGPLSDFCAVYTREDKDGTIRQVVSLDRFDCEYLNVLKLDALGLKTMAMIRIALEHIGMTLEELYSIPLDQEETIEGFTEGDVVGVFQFDGRAMRSVNSGVRPSTFMEVCDINALARPGPLHSGSTSDYIDVKAGRKKATHYHELVDNITAHTQYQIVYQEQILQTVRNIGGFTWDEAARIRKIISKKRGEAEFNEMRAKFVTGAAEHGIEEDTANKIFSLLATAGSYAFNAAHCVSYGMLAYWTMWLKKNHPLAFYLGCLRKYEKKRDELLRDAFKHGIEIDKLDINRSGLSWTVDKDRLRPGFVEVKGIGAATAKAILERRKARPFSGWADVQTISGIGPKTISLMKDFVEDPDPFGLDKLSRTLAEVKDALAQGLLTDELGNALPRPTHRSVDVPYEKTRSNVEIVWLGVIRDRNIKDLYELHHSRTGNHLDPATTRDPDLSEWVVMRGEDDTEPIVVTIDRWRYAQFKELAWDIRLDEDFVLVQGIKYGVQARRAIYVHRMWVLSVD